MGLDSIGGGDHQDGIVQHLQGPLHLRGEVHVAWGIQEGDLQLRGGKLRLFGKDGDAPAAFQTVGVQKGIPVVHSAQGLDGPGSIEQGLREGGFSRVHMGQQTDTEALFLFVHFAHGITSRWEI